MYFIERYENKLKLKLKLKLKIMGIKLQREVSLISNETSI